MSTSPSVKKALTALLRDPGNSNCADCKLQSHPRWASWSLGVFVCIKCAGVHRSLGTHITKVKSVDLDTWKEEHLEMLIKMRNNVEANRYYEANLPDSSSLKNGITDTNKLQLFIRTKYELKKWVGTPREVSEPPMSTTHEQVAKLSLESTSNPNSNSSSLLDIGSAAKKSVSANTNLKSTSLLNLATPSNSTEHVKKTHSHNERTDRVVTQRPDLKKSILSLYSKPSSNTNTNSSFFNNNANNNNIMSSASTSSLPSNHSVPTFSNNSNTTTSNLAFNNMSSSPSTSNNNQNNTNSNISLEDNDLFKNVWT
ncbi:hypothetical protein NCAS_0A13410 [Naumovozyma castellii]|uniref:Arf-GAP domain-containing protein n=1 Tax=Naumovozyma castellii TaxID=27288 RepID=G0V8V0_NAUCA|nr:hypothetical protein NCAS_0A13410 [Naumovozyma castellii CBS 4309]CCC67899.1 hypothetical protein NCAS_0A13410 [Naumovozyma castellii CBS 4309]